MLHIFNVVGDSIQWKSIKDDGIDNNEYHSWTPLDDQQILDSSFAYVDKNPVRIQLIKKHKTYKLKVSQRF